MRPLAPIWLAIALCSSPALAGDTTRALIKNPFLPGQYDIYDGGRRVGSVRDNPFVDGQYDVYDNAGQRDETLRRNPFIEGEYDRAREHDHDD